jgi:hypothetical protein
MPLNYFSRCVWPKPGVAQMAEWRFLGKTKGGTWNRPSRGRIDKHSTEPKYRYGWGAWPEFEEEPSVADIG